MASPDVSADATKDLIASETKQAQQKKKRRAGNRTVTFGDSGAVRSMPFWSVVSFVVMMLAWYVLTRAWGYPEAFKTMIEASALEANPLQTGGLRDRELFALCQRADECDTGAYTQVISPLTFPSVRDTWNAGAGLFSEGFKDVSLWTHAWASLERVLKGMAIGSLIGVPVGTAMALSSRLRGFFDSPVESFRPIPPLALLPLFTLTFGIGDKAAVPLLVFASVWIMIISTRSGIQNAQLSKVRAAYSLGASKWQLLRRVLIPNALPEIFTGIRVALGVSWGTLVAAELSGVQQGLGAMISIAKNFSRLDVIVVGIIIIAVLGVLMDLILRALEAKLIPWRGKG